MFICSLFLLAFWCLCSCAILNLSQNLRVFVVVVCVWCSFRNRIDWNGFNETPFNSIFIRFFTRNSTTLDAINGNVHTRVIYLSWGDSKRAIFCAIGSIESFKVGVFCYNTLVVVCICSSCTCFTDNSILSAYKICADLWFSLSRSFSCCIVVDLWARHRSNKK